MSASPPTVRVVLVGAAGRMGAQILRVQPEFPQVQLVGAVGSARSAGGPVGIRDPGVSAALRERSLALTESLEPLLGGADVVVDFSVGSAVPATLAACVRARVALLLGTTGWPEDLSSALESAARQIPVLVAANTSRGLWVMSELVARAAQALPSDYDLGIVETHHRNKRDAPSGTARALAAAARPRGASSAAAPIASVRGGDVIGEHEVLWLGRGERLSLRHSVTDRAVFARGALTAACWLAGQGPGRYGIGDVYSLTSIS